MEGWEKPRAGVGTWEALKTLPSQPSYGSVTFKVSSSPTLSIILSVYDLKVPSNQNHSAVLQPNPFHHSTAL